MNRLVAFAAALLTAACGSTSAAQVNPSPTVSRSARPSVTATAVATPSTGEGSKSPAPLPAAAPEVNCQGSLQPAAMVLTGGRGLASLIYDVTDPLHPKLVCSIFNTSVHLFNGDTFVYLKPVSANEADVVLHSIGSGNESKAASLPFNEQQVAWVPSGSLAAYTVADEQSYTVTVSLYAHGQTKVVHTFGLPIGDCICRFGLPQEVLSFSPDSEYLAAGWVAGKGSTPLTVIRVADGSIAFTAPDTTFFSALWSPSGHTLYLIGAGLQSWSPETGAQGIPGDGWAYAANISPDGTAAAYTAYVDPSNPQSLRVYTYDLKADRARLMIDKLRSEVIFLKDGWVWYEEETACSNATDPHCPIWGTKPTGTIFVLQLSTGVEQAVTFAPGDEPWAHIGSAFSWVLAPTEYWPDS